MIEHISNPLELVEDDTQPLSKAEIAKNIFSTRCLTFLQTFKVSAGFFVTLDDFREAKITLTSAVGRTMADHIMSDFFVENSHLFN